MARQRKEAIVVDIDGTLISSETGMIHNNVINEIKRLRSRFLYHIVILTARPKIADAQTRKLLNDIGIHFEMLVMKPTVHGDNATYKTNALKNSIMPIYDIKYIFDDDEWNIRAFQDLNLRTVLVNPETGDFRL